MHHNIDATSSNALEAEKGKSWDMPDQLRLKFFNWLRGIVIQFEIVLIGFSLLEI